MSAAAQMLLELDDSFARDLPSLSVPWTARRSRRPVGRRRRTTGVGGGSQSGRAASAILFRPFKY